MRLISSLPVLAVALVLSGCGAPQTVTPPPAVTTSVAPVIPPKPMIHADQVLAQSESHIRSLLGTPSLLRQDPPAQLWQYRGPACVLDVYLYETSAGFVSKHLAARGLKGQTMDPSACLAAISQDR